MYCYGFAAPVRKLTRLKKVGYIYMCCSHNPCLQCIHTLRGSAQNSKPKVREAKVALSHHCTFLILSCPGGLEWSQCNLESPGALCHGSLSSYTAWHGSQPCLWCATCTRTCDEILGRQPYGYLSSAYTGESSPTRYGALRPPLCQPG